ncbi:hypothetical protein ACFXKW_32615 [Streptomyces sp. NPDC059193]|uniref:hypothetical protein n=1 Tax=Streptomyces sp. NPDC059193 TaxID=3346763 RepID=UPI0036A19DC1
MVLGHLARTEAGPVPATAAPLVQDLLWAHAKPSDGLEHLRVQPGMNGLDVHLFVRARSDASAVAKMRELFHRVEQPVARHGFAVVAF